MNSNAGRKEGSVLRVYDQLQLNQSGSKALVKSGKTLKEKAGYFAVYVLKILLTVSFCMLFVTGFSMLFGAENSIAGVAVLLAVLVFRQADLGFHATHSAFVLLTIFGILAVGPHLANLLPPILALVLNFCCIFCLMFLGCHNILMSNQATLVLSYLLLMGYDVDGRAYISRLFGLAFGGVLTAWILYHNHRHKTYKRTWRHLFHEFRLDSSRNRWQLRLAVSVSLSIFMGSLFGMERVMWIGFAAMSTCQLFYEDSRFRIKHRMLGTLGGCALFFLLVQLLPESVYPFFGILGGIGVGFSVSYGWQTVFNALGALSIAIGIYSAAESIGWRIADNFFGMIAAYIFCKLFDAALQWVLSRKADLIEEDCPQ